MKLQIAKRNQAKIKMAIQGPSGGGKTMGALLVGYGIVNDWTKIAVIDTENHSASLYAHLGKYNVLNIVAPFTPEKYIEALHLCEQAKMEVIIIDSISHEWDGSGGILDIHSSMAGNSYTAWNSLTPRHNNFVQAMLQSPAHIIATTRAKQDYVLVDKNGKQVPQKVGLKGITREGMDYEFTIVLDLDIRHNVVASKDRTGLFMDKPDFKLTPQIGQVILNWCEQSEPLDVFLQRIINCPNIQELKRLFEDNPDMHQAYHNAFVQKKYELVTSSSAATNFLSRQNLNNNGSTIK